MHFGLHDYGRARPALGLSCLALCLLLAGCAEQEMDKQPKYQRLYQESTFFADGQSVRPLVAGTVARGQQRTDRAYYEESVGRPS